MSLTLNMVGGGSGGGISPNDALLVVYTPLGSSVTAINGTATKTSNTGIALSDRPTVEMHLIPIGSSQLGTWTVTATRGTDTNSTTISITAVEQYELYIGYHVPLQTYQEVEYLASTGTQRIDTGFKPSGSTVEFEITCEVDNQFATGDVFGGIFAARTNYNSKALALGSYSDGSAASLHGSFELLSSGSNQYDAMMVRYEKQTLSLHGNTYSSDNATVGGSKTITRQSFTAQYNLNLFCYNTANSYTRFLTGKIYFAKFWSGSDTVVRELYPCYRLSDSVAGLYDKTNDVFYTNAGSGTFTVGADV